MKEKISRERFIRLGSAIGVSVAGASVISACGGGSGSSGSASGSGGAASSSASTSSASSSTASSSASSGESTSSDASSSASDAATQEPSQEQSQEPSGGGQAIARASEVAPGSATKFKDSGNPAILVHLDSGEFAAFSAVCTHMQCTVAYRGGQLACPCHGSIFDAANGEVVNPPAQQPLPEIPIEVRGGEVFRA